MSKKYPTKDDGSPKGLSTYKKVEWVWNYYKWWIIGGIFAVIAVIYFIYSMLQVNPDAITILAIDVQVEDSSAANDQLAATFNDYLASIGDEDEKAPLELDDSLKLESSDTSIASTSVQKLTAIVLSNSANIVLADEAMVEKYGAQGMFTDLKDFLDEDAYQNLLDQGSLVSITIPADEDVEDSVEETFYAGIKIDALDMSSFSDAGFYLEDDFLICVPVNYEHEERTQAFMDMILPDDLSE